MGAARGLLLHGLHHRGMAVAEEERAVAHPVVDELVAVHVPLARSQRALHVDREGLEMAAVVGDPAGMTARARS